MKPLPLALALALCAFSVSAQVQSVAGYVGDATLATTDLTDTAAIARLGSANPGNLLFTDATYDIGANGATRPNNLWLANNATVSGNTIVGGNVSLGFSSTIGWNSDVFLARDNANVLGLRNGTNPQKWSVYNTYTSSSVFESLDFLFTGNAAYIQTATTGGTVRDMHIGPNGGASLYLRENGVDRIQINTSGKTLINQPVSDGLSGMLQVNLSPSGTGNGFAAFDAHGGVLGIYGTASAGTSASPTATTTAQVMTLGLRGIAGTDFSVTYDGAQMRFTPTATWNGSTHEAKWSLWATDPGSTTLTEMMNGVPTAGVKIISGGLTVGSTGTKISSVRRVVTAAMTAGAIIVSDSAITANSGIYPTILAPAGTPGALYVSSKTASTGYTITSTSALDTSTVVVRIEEP